MIPFKASVKLEYCNQLCNYSDLLSGKEYGREMPFFLSEASHLGGGILTSQFAPHFSPFSQHIRS